MSNLRITFIGQDGENFGSHLSEAGFNVTYMDMDSEKLLDQLPGDPQVIICLGPVAGTTSAEIAQSIRMNYPDHLVLYVTYKREKYNKRLLVKNGFSDTFFLPWEGDELLKILCGEKQLMTLPEMKDYIAVSTEDIFEDSIVSFPLKIHLTMNNKFIQYAHENEELSSDKILKLKGAGISDLYIHRDNSENFEKYVREKAARQSTHSRRKQLYEVNRELVAEILIDDTHENTFEKSRELMGRVKELVKELMLDRDTTLKNKLQLMGKRPFSFYHHLANVCAYSGYLAQELRINAPEEIALGGLFHDIGKLEPRPESVSDPVEWNKYHPQRSLDLLKSRRMVLPETSMKAILQHHEALDGTGFPKGLNSSKISIEAKILAIADRLDHLTSSRCGTPGLAVTDAFDQMLEENSDPKITILDTDLVRKLKTITRG
ncbi:MAG: HD domain-containing phosphohydrolase [Bdellovibrionota bacterium]